MPLPDLLSALQSRTECIDTEFKPPRGKPNAQEEKGSRPVTEADAEFALSSVGVLLRDMGWAHE
jgi:hypothetical protein